MDSIPINALFDLSGTKPNEAAGFDVRQTLDEAEVILARDVMSGDEFILFGRDVIRQIASGDRPEGAPTLMVELDRGPGSDDLERILGLIESFKGRHDYRGSQ